MTEAIPFLQKAILLSYDPRPFGVGRFVLLLFHPQPFHDALFFQVLKAEEGNQHGKH